MNCVDGIYNLSIALTVIGCYVGCASKRYAVGCWRHCAQMTDNQGVACMMLEVQRVVCVGPFSLVELLWLWTAWSGAPMGCHTFTSSYLGIYS